MNNKCRFCGLSALECPGGAIQLIHSLNQRIFQKRKATNKHRNSNWYKNNIKEDDLVTP